MTSLPNISPHWSDEFLNSMRVVTDLETDRIMTELFQSGENLLKLRPFLENWGAPITPDIPPSIREFLEAPIVFPDWVDDSKLERASETFVSYGAVTLMMILLDGFPHTLTNPSEARAFFIAQIFNPETIMNRMFQLPHFIISIAESGGLAQTRSSEDPSLVVKGVGILAAQKLRLIHSSIRLRLQLPNPLPEKNWDTTAYGHPINQEDLALALMSFCIVTVDGMRKLGFEISQEDEETRLHMWKTIGFLIGLREEMQPQSLEDAHSLFAIIHRRRAGKSPEGVAVLAELIRIMKSMLPLGYKSLPAGLMRYLLGKDTANMLQVPNPRRLMWFLTALTPVFAKDRIFAKIAKLMSPPLVHWLIHSNRTSNRGALNISAALARGWHSIR